MSCFESSPAPEPTAEVFALVRNAHEVIRGACIDLETTLAAPAADAATKRAVVDRFRAQWVELRRFLKIHHKMEDGALLKLEVLKTAEGLFDMIDRLDSDRAKAAHVRDAHARLASIERAVSRSLYSVFGSHAKLLTAYGHFKEMNEEHLKQVDEIMTPTIKKLNDDGADMRGLMRKSVLAALWDDDRAFFVSYGTRVLKKYPVGAPSAAEFVKIMQTLADSAEEWEADRVLIEAALGADEYKNIAAELNVKAFGASA